MEKKKNNVAQEFVWNTFKNFTKTMIDEAKPEDKEKVVKESKNLLKDIKKNWNIK